MNDKRQNQGIFQKMGTCVLGVALSGMLAVNAVAAPVASDITAQLCPNVNILVNGVSQTFYDAQGREVHPIAYNGTTYLPLRAVGELMGKNVNWDQSTLTVSLSGTRTAGKVTGTPDTGAVSQQITAQLRPDFTVVLEGTTRSFTDATGAAAYPLLYNGTTYLPLRAIGGLMGSTVGWDSASNTVTLTSGQTGSLVTDADSFLQNPGTTTTPAAPVTPTTPSAPVTPAPSTPAAPSSGTMISAETAKEKALAHAGLSANQVTFVSQKLDWEDGRQVYDVEFYTSDYKEYDYEIDAYTGAVVSFDYDAEYYSAPAGGTNNTGTGTNTGSYIGTEKVQSIVLSRVPGATVRNIVELDLDYDDGRWEYEGEIVYGNMEYEFEIDAYTGTVLSWEADRR